MASRPPRVAARPLSTSPSRVRLGRWTDADAERDPPFAWAKLTGDRNTDRGKRLTANNLMLHRGDLIASLADLDDPAAIDSLTPLLFDAESPSGFGRRDWEIWGGWVESGYGKKSWAASESAESAFSPCLQAPSGRPEAHAAIYRLLARQGRPSDLETLRRFDAQRGTAGGWAHVCDADDAIKEPYVDHHLRSNGLGLCRGWDAGGYRVTQSEALWLRRRLPNGSFGPPAWALDPGGDTIDPAAVFADRDGDGLPDRTEVAFGTDPRRADTDGDGIPTDATRLPSPPHRRTRSRVFKTRWCAS